MAGNSGYVDFFGTNYSSTQTLRVYWQETVSDAVGAKSTVAITKIQLSSGTQVGDLYFGDMLIKINGTTAVTLSESDGNQVYLTNFNTLCDVTRGGNQITGSVPNIDHDANGGKSVNITIEKNAFDYAGFRRTGAHFEFTKTSVSKSITLYTIPVATLSISAATGTTITVRRSGTEIESNANLYYGQQFVITFGITPGYQLDSHTVNGTTFTNGGTYTVGSTPTTVTVATTASRSLSTVSTSNGTFGVAQTVTVTRYVNTYTHTIYATCAGQNQTIATKSSSTSISWTPAVSIMNSITSAMSASCTITINTYNGDTYLGATSITITLSLPTTGTYSVKPTPSITDSDANGYASTYGGYVAGKSKLSVSISDGLKYSATIASRSTTANRITSAAASFDAGILTGNTTISTSVTDSRGQTSTASKSITVQSYTSPSITTISAHRTNSSGVTDDMGDYFTVSWAIAITALGNTNTRSLKLRYKRVTLSTWTEENIPLSAYSASGTTVAIAASGDYSWDIQLILADAFETVTKATKLSTAMVVESRRPQGKGVAFGKVAENDSELDVFWNLRARGDFLHPSNLLVSGTAIASNDDLNDYTTAGKFYSTDSTVTNTLANKPTGIIYGFSLYVLTQANGAKIQLIVQNFASSPSCFFYRIYTSSWSAWQTIWDSGNMVTVSGKFASSSDWGTAVSYPAGFDQNNCQIISFEVYNASVWKTGYGLTATQDRRTFAALQSGGVNAYNNDSTLYGADYRVCLKRL